ncbi:MAG TPA: hypothetical protein VGB79_04690 [Allosphingosinicella sp.]
MDRIMAETARAKDAQRDGQWITYLVRDPRRRDKRGNAGTPIYVGQTNDFPERVLSRFTKCEKQTAGKGKDCIERRVADLLHLGIVATYQLLEYQPTRLTSLISETNWARRCWNAGYNLANRAELQNAGGPPISRSDVPRSWLLKFSVEEALVDDVRVTLSCGACGEALPIPLARIPELEKPATAIGHLAKLWRAEECTLCGASGERRFRVCAE